MARLEAQVAEIAKADEDCQRLMSIPQVGPFTALVIQAEVGDIHRFREAKQLVAYCGLCPSVYASGGKVSYGRLSKTCNLVLRYALLLRASGMTKLPHDNPLKQAYWRVAVHDQVNSGKLNLARKLVRIIYAMLTQIEDWNPAPMMACIA